MAPGSANPFKPVSPGGVLDGSITVAVYVPSANFVDGVAAFQSMAPMQPQPPYPGKVCCSQASRTIYCLSAQLVGISGHPACVCPESLTTTASPLWTSPGIVLKPFSFCRASPGPR